MAINTIEVAHKSPTFLSEKSPINKVLRSLRQSQEGAVQRKVSTFFNSNSPSRSEPIVRVPRANDQSTVLTLGPLITTSASHMWVRKQTNSKARTSIKNQKQICNFSTHSSAIKLTPLCENEGTMQKALKMRTRL